jgi:hypothetical protein
VLENHGGKPKRRSLFGFYPGIRHQTECCAWAKQDVIKLLVDIVGFPSSHEVAYPNSKVTYHSNSRYELLKQDEYKFVSDI